MWGECEAKDSPVGIDESEEIVCLILKVLDPGYLLVEVDDPAQLFGFICVSAGLLASRGDLTSVRQPE